MLRRLGRFAVVLLYTLVFWGALPAALWAGAAALDGRSVVVGRGDQGLSGPGHPAVGLAGGAIRGQILQDRVAHLQLVAVAEVPLVAAAAVEASAVAAAEVPETPPRSGGHQAEVLAAKRDVGQDQVVVRAAAQGQRFPLQGIAPPLVLPADHGQPALA